MTQLNRKGDQDIRKNWQSFIYELPKNQLLIKQTKLKMKKLLKITLGLALMLGFGISSGFAQVATTSPAKMEILKALTIALEAGTEINFGNVSAITPGEIKLDANDAANNTNTGVITNVAQFNINGQENTEVIFAYDATVTLENQATAGVTVTMTPDVVGAQLAGNRATATDVANGVSSTVKTILEPTAGTYFIWVGGTIPQLTAPGQATGEYLGTFNISVEYN